MSDHLQRSPDPIGDVTELTGGGKPRASDHDPCWTTGSVFELRHQTPSRIALQPQPAKDVLVGDLDRVVDDVHDVDVVPDTGGGQLPAANLHPVDRVVVEHVPLDQRTGIADHVDAVDRASGATVIVDLLGRE